MFLGGSCAQEHTAELARGWELLAAPGDNGGSSIPSCSVPPQPTGTWRCWGTCAAFSSYRSWSQGGRPPVNVVRVEELRLLSPSLHGPTWGTGGCFIALP